MVKMTPKLLRTLFGYAYTHQTTALTDIITQAIVVQIKTRNKPPHLVAIVRGISVHNVA